jgi:branched-chain amino acid transport system permease protein
VSELAGAALAVIVLSAVYSLINLGMVQLYASTGVVTFAQGQMMMLGAFVMTSALTLTHGNWYVALLVSLVLLGLVGVLMYQIFLRFLIGAPEFPRLVVTLMLSIVLVQIVAIVWGSDQRIINAPHSGFATIRGLAGLLRWSVLGIRLRALAGNETLAIYGGVNVHVLASAAWAVSAALAALGGVIVGERTSVSISLGDIGFGAFPAAIIGGLRSPGGSLVGGVMVAAVQVAVTLRFNAQAAELAIYVLLLTFLTVRPNGLFGAVAKKRL